MSLLPYSLSAGVERKIAEISHENRELHNEYGERLAEMRCRHQQEVKDLSRELDEKLAKLNIQQLVCIAVLYDHRDATRCCKRCKFKKHSVHWDSTPSFYGDDDVSIFNPADNDDDDDDEDRKIQR